MVYQTLLLFQKKNATYDLSYFYQLTKKSRIRSHYLYNEVTGDDGKLEYGFKLGYNRFITQNSNWLFYYGLDVENQLTFFNTDSRSKSVYGVRPFIGIQFYVSKSFSFSTEPTFSAIHIISSDPTNFGAKTTTWNEYKLDNIGLVNLNFQF